MSSSNESLRLKISDPFDKFIFQRLHCCFVSVFALYYYFLNGRTNNIAGQFCWTHRHCNPVIRPPTLGANFISHITTNVATDKYSHLTAHEAAKSETNNAANNTPK